jgi:hypothetical protein
VTSSVKLGGAAGSLGLAAGVPFVGGADLLSVSLGALGLLATIFVTLETRSARAREGQDKPTI